MFNFTSNYRGQINFTFEAMDSAKVALARLRDGYLKHLDGTEDVSDDVIKQYEEEFLEAINDDLNMPVAMSVVWDVVKNPKKSIKLANLLLKFDEVLGLDLKNYEKKDDKLPEEIQKLVDERNEARKNKNWMESDKIRDILIEKGYNVKDSKEGTVVEKQ
jgi:cysteinyl-tRNA synthetase